jgi:hypothetical protein
VQEHERGPASHLPIGDREILDGRVRHTSLYASVTQQRAVARSSPASSRQPPTYTRAVKALALAAVAFGLLVSAAQADSSTLVLGVSVGDVRMGATKAQIVAAHGRPMSLKRLNYGGRPFELAVYAEHGGRLEVFYDRSTHRVVGVATSSPFYRTGNGFGVGAPAAAARARGFTWNGQCTLTYLKSAGGISYELSTRRHSRSGAIANISFVKSAYAGDC